MASQASSRAPLALSLTEVQAITRALADPRRFEILQQIAGADGNRTSCSALRDAHPISPATLSHHIGELTEAGLVESTRRGKFVDVTFRRDVWNAYLRALNQL